MKARLLRLCVAALAVIGFLTLSSRASADTIDTLNLTYNGGGNGQNGGGPFTWTQSGAPNTNFATSFQTYCIDTQDTVKSGTFITHTDLSAAPTIGNNTTKIAAINTLYDHFYNSSFSSATNEAAFQAALWSLVYGTSTSNTTAQYLLAGNMYNGATYNGVEHDLANAHLVALVDSSGVAPGVWGRNQDQILVVPNSTKPVPAPPAVMLAGIGMLALLGRSRWTRRTPAAA